MKHGPMNKTTAIETVRALMIEYDEIIVTRDAGQWWVEGRGRARRAVRAKTRPRRAR